MEDEKLTKNTSNLNYEATTTGDNSPVFSCDDNKIFISDTALLSYSTGEDEVYTEIEVNPKNSFTAKFILFAVGSSHIDTEVISRIGDIDDIKTEISARAYTSETKDVYLNVMYRGNSDVFVEIQPIGYNNIPAEIQVPPNNRMRVMFEVQQPPIVTNTSIPTQDSFTREHIDYQTINYGANSTMVVGRSEDDIWRSFVQFDLSSVNPSYVLTESYLRLYYKGARPDYIKLEILNADKRWNEFSITHLNKPNPIKLISNEFTINDNYGYVEFDVLNIVKDWVALKTDNNGFVIRVANETEFGQITFNTRESIRPPQLIVKHFDSRIFSQGRSHCVTEIFAIHRGNSDKLTEVTVTSAFAESVLDTYLYVHRVEVPVESETFAEILVNKKYVPIEITSAIPVKENIETELAIRVPREKRLPMEIAVNRPETLAEIKCVISDANEIDTIVTANKPFVYTEISASLLRDSEVLLEIDIDKKPMSNKHAEITVTKPAVATEVSSRVGRNKDLYTAIGVTRTTIDVEIFSKYRSEIWVEIEPNIKSDVQTEITATKPYIDVSLTVKQYGDERLDTEIFVSYLSETHAEIDVKAVSQVDAEIDIKLISQVLTEISVTRKEVLTTIVIPTWVDYWVHTEIRPRILKVSNVPTMIRVGGYVEGGSYAFII